MCSAIRCFKNLAKFTGKHLCQSLFFNKVVGKESLTQLCFFECCYVGMPNVFTVESIGQEI